MEQRGCSETSVSKIQRSGNHPKERRRLSKIDAHCLKMSPVCKFLVINPCIAQLNPIYHPLALLGAHHIFHIRRLRVNTINEIFSS